MDDLGVITPRFQETSIFPAIFDVRAIPFLVVCFRRTSHVPWGMPALRLPCWLGSMHCWKRPDVFSGVAGWLMCCWWKRWFVDQKKGCLAMFFDIGCYCTGIIFVCTVQSCTDYRVDQILVTIMLSESANYAHRGQNMLTPVKTQTTMRQGCSNSFGWSMIDTFGGSMAHFISIFDPIFAPHSRPRMERYKSSLLLCRWEEVPVRAFTPRKVLRVIRTA